MFVPGRPSQPTLMFVGKLWSLSKSGAAERGFPWEGSNLYTNIIWQEERFAKEKHSSLLLEHPQIIYVKSFYNIAPVRLGQCWRHSG